MSANLACGGWYWEGSAALSPTCLSLSWADLSVSFSRGGKGVQRKNRNNPSIQALEYLNWTQISPSTSQSLLWNKRTDDDLQRFGMIYSHTACVTLTAALFENLQSIHPKAERGQVQVCDSSVRGRAAGTASVAFPRCKLRAQWTQLLVHLPLCILGVILLKYGSDS